MADLKLTADFSDLQTLRRELVDIPKKARDSARTFEAEFARVERILVKQARQFQKNASESQKYYSELLKLDRGAKSAERSAEVFTRELEKQEKVAKRVGQVFRDQTAQAVRSLAQEFARSGDQSAYLSGINKIVNSQKMLQAGSRTSRSEIMRLGNEFRQQAKFANELAVAQGRVAAAVQGSNKGLARSGVVMQQTGYQVGDLLVQIQSGTNFFVAFGQQATQLAGLLTMSVNPKIIALGAGLSIAIPLLTAIAAAFMRTRQTTEDTVPAVDRLGTALESLADIRFDPLNGGLSAISSEAERLLGILEDVRLERARSALSETFQGVLGQGTLGDVRSAISSQFAPGGAGLLPSETEFASISGLSQDLVDNYLAVQRVLSSISGDTAPELAQSIAEAVVSLEDQELLTDELKQSFNDIITSLNLEQELLKQGNILLGERAELYTKTQDFVNSQIDNLNKEIALQEQIAKYGEDSVQVARLQAQFARNEYADRLRAAGAAEDVVERVMKLYDANVASTEQADKTTSALEELAGLNLGSLRAEIDFLIRRLNIGEEAARAMALAMPVGVRDGTATRGGRGMTLAMGRARPNFERDLGIGRYADKPKRERQDPLQQLEQQLKLEQELLGKTEAQRRVIQALGVDWRSYGDATIERLVGMVERMDEFNEKVAQQEDIANTIAGSFGDAFMSIVDGTKSAKDAFRDMARSIIRRLYEIMVVESMVQSIAGAIMGGFGGGGPTRPVMRPTPQASGGYQMPNRPYLVGEHGPELVIPGRSGTVMNADLTNKAMGGESIVINNNINVTGGTDPAAIRMEVAKLMPQITNATKTAVIDARRRGGQMKAAFG